MKKLLWPSRNCRKSRSFCMRIRPLSLSCFLFTHKKGSKDFKDYNSSNTLHKTNKVSNFLVQFLKQEAEKFALRLVKSESIGSDIHKEMVGENSETGKVYKFLDPRIGNQINGIADNYNKFSLLLSFHPIMIDPRLYVYFYESTSVMIDFDMKKLLLRRLVYHRNFEECWRVFFSTATAFNDLDEFVDIFIDELKIRDNFTYGIYLLLYSGYESIPDKNLIKAIIETFCYRVGLAKENVYSVFAVIEGIRDGIIEDYPPGLENFTSEQILFFRLFRYRMRLQKSTIASTENSANRESLNRILSDLFFDKELISKSGWLSLLLIDAKVSLCFGDNPRVNTDGVFQTTECRLSRCLFTYLKKNNELNINEYEYLLLLRYVNSENIEDLCQICEKHFLLNFHIVNYMMSTCLVHLENPGFVRDFSVRHFNLLSSRQLSGVLGKFFFGSKSNYKLLCNKIKKNSSSATSRETVESFVRQPYAENSLPPSLEILKQIVGSFNKLDLAFIAVKGAMNVTLKYNYRECDLIQFYSYIVSDIRLTSHNFVEVTRQVLLRHIIIDPDLIAKLFEKILSKCWNSGTIMKRNRKIKDIDDNFKKLYYLANKNEKARFHNRIRSFGQLLSLLDLDKCAKVLNILHRYLWKNHFDFTNSLQGKEYIMKCLITETLRFINKENKNATDAILKMKALVQRLEFSSPAARCSLYKYIVRDLPSKGVSILHSYKERKSYLTNDIMRSIMSGLLSSHRLKDHEKIQYFREFRSELKALGYKSKIHKSTAVELLNLVTRMIEKCPEKSSDTVKWIFNYSRQKRIPKDVTQNLRRRLLTKHSYRHFQAH